MILKWDVIMTYIHCIGKSAEQSVRHYRLRGINMISFVLGAFLVWSPDVLNTTYVGAWFMCIAVIRVVAWAARK